MIETKKLPLKGLMLHPVLAKRSLCAIIKLGMQKRTDTKEWNQK
jgi:hypothetical protein